MVAQGENYEFLPKGIVKAFESDSAAEIADWLGDVAIPGVTWFYDAPGMYLQIFTSRDGQPLTLNSPEIGSVIVVTQDNEVHAVERGAFNFFYSPVEE